MFGVKPAYHSNMPRIIYWCEEKKLKSDGIFKDGPLKAAHGIQILGSLLGGTGSGPEILPLPSNLRIVLRNTSRCTLSTCLENFHQALLCERSAYEQIAMIFELELGDPPVFSILRMKSYIKKYI